MLFEPSGEPSNHRFPPQHVLHGHKPSRTLIFLRMDNISRVTLVLLSVALPVAVQVALS
jgi:hypothetical protein